MEHLNTMEQGISVDSAFIDKIFSHKKRPQNTSIDYLKNNQMILATLKSGRDNIEQLQTIRTIIENNPRPISSKRDKNKINYIQHNK